VTDLPDPCQHEWTLILSEQTWSGPRRVSVCSRCHALLSEYLSGPAESPRPPSSTQAFGAYIRDRVRNGGAPELGLAVQAQARAHAGRWSHTRLTSESPSSGRVPRQRD
jgi:hypothetical protein